MRDDQHRFLSLLGEVPARLTVEQTAWVLNCQPYDVPVLVAAHLLRPLGKPQPNSVKYFATAEILAAARNPAWLSKLTVTLSQHWQKKNRRSAHPSELHSLAVDNGQTRPPQVAAGS